MVEDSIEKYMWFWIRYLCVCVSAPNSVMKIDVCVPFYTMETQYFLCTLKTFIATILELEYILM